MKHILFNTVYNIRDIFSLKSEKFGKAFLIYLLSMVLITVPISISLMNSKTINYALFGADLALNEQPGLLNDLPAFVITSGGLTTPIDFVSVTNLNDSFIIVVNPTEDAVDLAMLNGLNGVIFNSQNYTLSLAGNPFTFNYNTFQNLHSSDLKNMASNEAMTRLYDQLYVSAKRVFLLPVIVLILVIFTAINLIYVSIISLIAGFLKYKDQNVPGFNEIMKIAFFSSLLPSMVGALIGLLAPPISIVFYNFGLPLVMFISYLKYRNIELSNVDKKIA